MLYVILDILTIFKSFRETEILIHTDTFCAFFYANFAFRETFFGNVYNIIHIICNKT